MKKFLLFTIIFAVCASMLISLPLAGCKTTTEATAAEATAEDTVAEDTTAHEPVTLKYTVWLAEPFPTQLNTILDTFEAKYPWITVEVSMVAAGEYSNTLQTDLAIGAGPDLCWIEPFSNGRALYNAGYLVTLDETTVPLLSTLSTFDEAAASAFESDDGIPYAIPLCRSSHGVYYNKTIFDANGLTEPTTWAELIAVCEALKAAGITPFANGVLVGPLTANVWYPGLGANFYGGEDAMKAVAEGTMKITDQPFVDAFKAIKELQQYCSEDFISLDYIEGISMFTSGQCAMSLDGSWMIPLMLSQVEGTDIVIDWFGPPVVNAGDTPWLCLSIDNGLAINKNTKHLEEALLLLNWCTTTEWAQLGYANIPGTAFCVPGEYTFASDLDKKINDFRTTAKIHNRTFQAIFDVKDPSPLILITEAVIGMFKDDFTPEQAAQHVQDGMATWYPPLMN